MKSAFEQPHRRSMPHMKSKPPSKEFDVSLEQSLARLVSPIIHTIYAQTMRILSSQTPPNFYVSLRLTREQNRDSRRLRCNPPSAIPQLLLHRAVHNITLSVARCAPTTRCLDIFDASSKGVCSPERKQSETAHRAGD
jgi:hypothetical protein